MADQNVLADVIQQQYPGIVAHVWDLQPSPEGLRAATMDGRTLRLQLDPEQARDLRRKWLAESQGPRQ